MTTEQDTAEQDGTITERLAPPVGDDTSVYVEGLAASPTPARRRPRSRSTTLLAVLLVAAAGFAAGARVGRDRASATTGGASEELDTTVAEGGSDGTVRRIAGQVRLVDGTTIYVADQQGNIVKVTTGRTSTVTKTQPASVGDIRPADNVVVFGAAGPDGTVSATQVADTGTSGADAGGFPPEGGGAHGRGGEEGGVGHGITSPLRMRP